MWQGSEIRERKKYIDIIITEKAKVDMAVDGRIILK
jgi:hypothetical protein